MVVCSEERYISSLLAIIAIVYMLPTASSLAFSSSSFRIDKKSGGGPTTYDNAELVEKENDVSVSTCSDLKSHFARIRVLPKEPQLLALQAETCNTSEQEVWICPHKKFPEDASRLDFFLGFDCAEMKTVYSRFADDQMRDLRHGSGFDYQEWCKNCHGVAICPDGHIIIPSLLGETPNEDVATVVPNRDLCCRYTCNDAVEYAFYITQKGRCREMLDQDREVCFDPDVAPIGDYEAPSRELPLAILCIVLAITTASMLVFCIIKAMEIIDSYWSFS